jgi:hypothetical protein
MRSSRHKPRLTRFALLAAAVTLAGCHIPLAAENPVDEVNSHLFDSANLQQLQRPMRNQVEPISLVHTVSFDAEETQLGAQELARLAEFLDQAGVGDGARIELDGPRDMGGYHDPVTEARLAALEAELTRIGLRSAVPARPRALLGKPEDRIAVTVTRAMVIPPDCDPGQPRFATRPGFVFSCSNTAILGQMIADPVDLEQGRALGPADAESSTLAIRRYRAGTPRPINPETTQ